MICNRQLRKIFRGLDPAGARRNAASACALRARAVGLGVLMLLFRSSSLLWAQIPTNSYQSHYVIVGKLSGRDDYRSLSIKTAAGFVALNGSASASAFEVLERDDQRVRLIFTKMILETRSPSVATVEDLPIGVEMRFYATERSLVSAILLEEVDYAELDNEASALEIEKARPNYRILPARPEPNTVELICYNFAHPLLREKVLRQALSHALNREKIKKQFLLDKADLARGAYEKNSHFAASGMRDFGYNPKSAISLLEGAGWREINRDRVRMRNGQPLRFRLFFPEGLRLSEQLVRQIKIDWNQIGIDVVPVPLKAAALHDSLQSGQFDAVLLRRHFEESMADFVNFFGDGAGRGLFHYVNPRYHHIVRFSRNFKEPEEILMQAMNLQLLHNEDQAATFLFHPWLTFHVMNAMKFANLIGGDGLPRPFEEWVIRRQP